MTQRMTHILQPVLTRFGAVLAVLCLSILILFAGLQPVQAQVSPFRQALAEAAANDRDIAQFYRDRAFEPLWTGPEADHSARRSALLAALSRAGAHGLPVSRYDVAGLRARMGTINGATDHAAVEIALSEAFLNLARDMRSGVLVPSRVDADLVRQVDVADRLETLVSFARAEPRAFLASLAPQSHEYARLAKAKLQMKRVIRTGGWGAPVGEKALEPGSSSAAVIRLRNRLVAMGYMERSVARSYDAAVQKAVQAFQMAHGLPEDGVAGAATLRAIDISPEQRLQSIIVAMERERWLNAPLGPRHILVNLTDFSATVIDNGRERFRTRAVIGKNTSDRRTPEFSDVMDHIVINPTWNVPRSITTREYLPQLQRNPNAVSHLRVVDSRGRVVSRGSVNFAAYSARSFPYRLKQPPGQRNALGLVKFMFPNKYNIYLHDTPAKDLFSRDVRAYSHGCVRLQQPFDFAYTLLEAQEANPVGYFQSILKTGRETRVNLAAPVPVHIIYRTAFTDAKGRVQYREDIYGRDAAIWSALSQAGVSLASPQS